MVGKIDNLFAPERLREKWVNKKEVRKNGHDYKIGKIASTSSHKSLYDNILTLINKRFSGQYLEILNNVMAELKIQLDLKSCQTNKHLIPDEENIVINTAIDHILAEIEDLVEAFG